MCQFIPTHIYTNLLKNGDQEQKDFASQALLKMKQFAYDPSSIVAELMKAAKERQVEEETVNRSIYDAEHKMSLPGKLVRKEGEKSNGDVSADEAYDGLGKTYEFFQSAYSRNSIDGKGMELVGCVNFGRNFANAFWNGSTMVFGNGDGKIFNKFTILDVISHEMSHGITQSSADLVYEKMPGALNESFSDVFGSMTKQFALGQTVDKADWLIGEGLFTKNVKGRALRDMAKPGSAFDDPKIGKDQQTAHMDEYNTSPQDNFCVHINSGIPNRAFYNVAMLIGGNSWERAGLIWYKTLLTKLKPRSQFQDCANATLKVSNDLYGKDSKESKAVVEGWKVVGLKAK